MTYFKRSQDDTVPQLHIAVGNLVTEQLEFPFSLCHTSHESNLNIERISYFECTELQIHREFHIMDGHNSNYIYISSLTDWANAQICSLSDWIEYKLNRNGQMLVFSWAQLNILSLKPHGFSRDIQPPAELHKTTCSKEQAEIPVSLGISLINYQILLPIFAAKTSKPPD